MSDKPEKLVTISYRKDGKTYLLSMPSEHAEWAEEMLSLDVAEVERAAAARALEEAADADDRQADYLIDTMPDAFSGLTKERFHKREEAYELRRVATRLRARAGEIREVGKS